MIHAHVGNYLKQLVVSQGFTIKDFSIRYGTTQGYMGEIFDHKEDVNTSVIRKVGSVLGVDFNLTSSIDKLLIDGSGDERFMQKPIIAGRPISMEIRKVESENATIEALRKELALKDETLRAKDEIIKAKEELIMMLKEAKN